MSTLLGTSLNGRYRLEARIGAGGMSTVYRALDVTLERQVAIKLMNREVASDSDQLERFRREARAVAQLSHPHIVGVIDAGEDDGRPYIVLEYVEGETLKERIRRNGRLPIPEAVAYAIEIARALGAAHARHIVHRDVKPQNVLIDQEGSAKVTDFGIARTLEEDGLTADGRVLGTTDYVSPEQALGQHVTGQSDLYSLGIVLYEMLTGEVPFRGENQVAVAMKHVREEIPDVQSKRPEVSAALAAVLETTTAKRESDRYADDTELIADLEDVLGLETARAGSVTGEVTTVLRTLPSQASQRVPLRLRHRLVALGMVLVVAAVAAAVIAFLVPRTHHGASPLPQPAPKQTPAPGDALQLLRARLQPGRAVGRQGSASQHRQPRDRRRPQHLVDDRDLLQQQPRQARRGALRRRQAGRGRRVNGDRHRHPRVRRLDLCPPHPTGPQHLRRRVAQGGLGRQRAQDPDDPAAHQRHAAIATTWCGSPTWATTTRWRSTRSRSTGASSHRPGSTVARHQVRSGRGGAVPAIMAAAAASIGRAWAAKASRSGS